MCGFLVEVYQRINNSKLEETCFEQLLALSEHRGPDSSEIESTNKFRFGFNRLAILDTSEKGNQPKYSKSKRYVFVFNGELYNYKKLIVKYKITNLDSGSDTEVLVHLFDDIGIIETIKELNGMFAISVFDTETDQLYLTRDFAGIKPLFYGVSEKGIVAASQFDQIFKHPFFVDNLSLRPEIVKEYFGFGYMQAPNTIYKNIFQVNPGEMIMFRKGELCEQVVISSFSKKQVFKTNKTNYLDVLTSIIKRQLVSDVPIATFISGGVDSPLVSACAHRIDSKIKGYTIGVNDVKFDESEKAKEYANHIGLNHSVETITEKQILNEFDSHFKYLSEPFGDYSSLPTHVVTKMASKDNTVMLSGDGGDELFLGYPRMLHVYKNRLFFLFPMFFRKIIFGILRRLNLVKTYAPNSFQTIGEWVLNKQLKINQGILNSAFTDIDFSIEHKELYTRKSVFSGKSLLSWLRWNEFYAHMQRVLIKVDRTSMGNSIEVRVPFLDKESITYAWQTQIKQYQSNDDLKRELKASLASFIPKPLIEKKKKGFSIPLHDWLHYELKDEVNQLVFDTKFYGENSFDADVLRNYVKDYYANKHSNAWGVWHIYAWQKWAASHLKFELSV